MRKKARQGLGLLFVRRYYHSRNIGLFDNKHISFRLQNGKRLLMYVERKRARGHLPTIALEHSISWKSKVIGELICVLGLRVAGERSSALTVARPFLLWAAPSSRSARSARRNSTTPIWQTSTSSSTVAALPLRLALLVLLQLLALLALLQLLVPPRLLARKHQPLDVYEKRLRAGRFSFACKTPRAHEAPAQMLFHEV